MEKDCPLVGTLPKGVHHFGESHVSNADHDNGVIRITYLFVSLICSSCSHDYATYGY